MYAAGWLATGPTGVILTTMSNAFATAESIVSYLRTSDALKDSRSGSEVVLNLLKKDNVQIVGWNDWKKIEKYEEEEGKKLGKPRRKILDVTKMLEIAS